MSGRLGTALLAGAALLVVGCTLPGPVIVVTEPGYVATADTAVVRVVATGDAPTSATTAEEGPADPVAPPSQLDAVETQRKAVERRVATLKQGMTRVKGRHLVTEAIRDAVVNRVGTLESRIAALEAEFDRRAQRLDSMLDGLRKRIPATPTEPVDATLPVEDPAL